MRFLFLCFQSETDVQADEGKKAFCIVIVIQSIPLMFINLFYDGIYSQLSLVDFFCLSFCLCSFLQCLKCSFFPEVESFMKSSCSLISC